MLESVFWRVCNERDVLECLRWMESVKESMLEGEYIGVGVRRRVLQGMY